MPCCAGVFTANTMNWCTLRSSFVIAAGAQAYPTFHPVACKVLPKLEIRNARSASAGCRATLSC